jgi:hypothetical protein
MQLSEGLQRAFPIYFFNRFFVINQVCAASGKTNV